MSPPVVFLHGLARTHRSLSVLRRYVEKSGFATWARTYPSRRQPIEQLADVVGGWLEDELGRGPLLGVTHSMGGIVARHLADRFDWRGIVMLAPPNSGSQVAARLMEQPLFRWYFGPAAQELSDPSDWPPPPTPTGVIAGTRGPSLTNVPSWVTSGLSILPNDEPSDGTLAVSETRHPAVTDFVTVDASHTWIMNHPVARELVVRFLRQGDFREQALLPG